MSEKLTFIENLCLELGSTYQIIEINSDYIISRRFDNGHYVEIEFSYNPAHIFYCTIHLYKYAEKMPVQEAEAIKKIGSISNIFSVEDLDIHLSAIKARKY